MPNRVYSIGGYRYGFNGQEKDDEVKGKGNSLDFGDRIYDDRLGRWVSIDRFAHQAPSWSPYRAFFCNPNLFTDPNGEYELPATVQKQYPMFASYIKNNISNDVMSSSVILTAFDKNTAADNPDGKGNLTAEKVRETVKWNSGPTIIVRENPGGMEGANGHYNSQTGQIELSKARLDELEKILSSDAPDEQKLQALTPVYMTLLHETTHYGDYLDGIRQDGGEPGDDFEYDVWFSAPVEIDGKQEQGRYFLGDKYKPEEVQQIIDKKMETTEGKKTLPTLPSKPEKSSTPPKK